MQWSWAFSLVCEVALKGIATSSPQRQRGESLDGWDSLTAGCQNIPAI